MLQFFTFASCLCYITAHSQYIYKSASLSPLITNDSGASISVIHNDVSTSEDGWDITVNDQIGFHLLLSLDNTWGFHPTAISTITITIDSTTNISTYHDLDLLLSFTSTHNEYFTTIIKLDNKVANDIYPACNDDADDIITPLATGNILSLTMADNYTNSTFGRAWKSKGGLSDSNIIPNNKESGYLNEFPITLEIINDPILGYSQFRVNEENWGIWTQGCVYSAFPTDEGLSVYLAAEDQNEILNIHDIVVEYEYDLDETDMMPSTSLQTANTIIIDQNDDVLFDDITSTMNEVIKEPTYNGHLMDRLLTKYLIYIIIGIAVCFCLCFFCIVILGINCKRTKNKQKPSMYIIDEKSGKNTQMKHCVVAMTPQSLSNPVHLTLNDGFPTTSSNFGDVVNRQQSLQNERMKSKTVSTDFEENVNEFSFIADTNYMDGYEENVDLYMNEEVNDVKKLKILKPPPVPIDALPLHKQLSLISITTHSNHPSQQYSPCSPTLSDEKSISVSPQQPNQLSPVYNRQLSTLSTTSNISHASDYDVMDNNNDQMVTDDGMDEDDGDNPHIKRDEFIIKNQVDDALDVDTKGNHHDTTKQIEGEFEFYDDEKGEDITPEPPSNDDNQNNNDDNDNNKNNRHNINDSHITPM